MDKGICKTDGCEKAAYCRGLCTTHYRPLKSHAQSRIEKGYSPDTIISKLPKKPAQSYHCPVPGCEQTNYCKRHGNMIRRYSLSPQQVAEFEAKTKCDICDKPRDGGFSIDHDHTCCPGRDSCGKCVRGVICMACNIALERVDQPGWLIRAQAYIA